MGSALTPAARMGRGEPLVLLHELGLTWHSWGRCVEGLARRHEVWAPTLPGHWGGPELDGEATPTRLVDALERQLDNAGFGQVHVAGNGFGAWLATELARRGRADSVSLIGPLGLWHDDPTAARTITTEVVRRHAISPLLALADNHVAGELTRRAAMRSLTGRSAPALVDLCPETKRRTTITIAAPIHCTVLRQLLHSQEFHRGWEPAIDESAITTIITGERDRLMHRPARELIPDPRALAHHLPEHGHVPMLDDPDTIIRHITTGVAAASRLRAVHKHPRLPPGAATGTNRAAPASADPFSPAGRAPVCL